MSTGVHTVSGEMYWHAFVAKTPEMSSVAVSVTVTSDFCHPDGALSVVTGGVESILTVTDFSISSLPASSVALYDTLVSPGAEIVNGPCILSSYCRC